jgi:hypothetical protein
MPGKEYSGGCYSPVRPGGAGFLFNILMEILTISLNTTCFWQHLLTYLKKP